MKRQTNVKLLFITGLAFALVSMAAPARAGIPRPVEADAPLTADGVNAVPLGAAAGTVPDARVTTRDTLANLIGVTGMGSPGMSAIGSGPAPFSGSARAAALGAFRADPVGPRPETYLVATPSGSVFLGLGIVGYSNPLGPRLPADLFEIGPRSGAGIQAAIPWRVGHKSGLRLLNSPLALPGD